MFGVDRPATEISRLHPFLVSRLFSNVAKINKKTRLGIVTCWSNSNDEQHQPVIEPL